MFQGDLGQSTLGDIENPTAVTSDLVLVSSASPQYVQAGSTEGRLLSSLAGEGHLLYTSRLELKLNAH